MPGTEPESLVPDESSEAAGLLFAQVEDLTAS